MTLPLPWALDHVHCYAIEAAAGWTLVDTGLGTARAATRWAEALRRLGSPAIHRILLTHYHPDHVGAGAALAELTGAREVLQGRLDAELARRAWGADRDLAGLERYLTLHGMPQAVAREAAADEGALPVTLASPTRLLDEGDVLELGGEPFRVLVLPGHADGHLALLGERSGRMFGGDVLLEEITPNVGRWEDTEPDPLGRYLATLERIAGLAPTVVYPGHRRPVERAAARCAEIRAHHLERLDRCEDALRRGADTAFAVALRLWGDSIGPHEQPFALVESIAHLERLVADRRARELGPGRWGPPSDTA